jgi:hypothetical protein
MKKGKIMDDRGDAVMVTSVLLLSIFLSVGSSYLLDYGKVVGKENDMAHASDIEESFLRTRASMRSLLKARDTKTFIYDRYTLGTPGNPYLTVARSSGTLSADPDPDSFQMQIVIEDGASENILNTVNGVMTYESNNYYFHDQIYHFTAGGVVLEQYGSQVMSATPDIDLLSTPGGNQIRIFLYGITNTYWRISGIESLPVSHKLAGSSEIDETILPGQSVSFRINGVGERAWYDYMRGMLVDNGMTEGVDFTATAPADWDDPLDEVEIDITAVTELYARIGEMEVTL